MTDIVLLAGNGFVGQATAVQLAGCGASVLVHHTGARPVPVFPTLGDIVVPRTKLPITRFPEGLIGAAAGAAVVHFQCMGRPDAQAFVAAFDGVAKRLVLVSSADVYQAYGRFIGTERGLPIPTPLGEDAPLRTRRYPYRTQAGSSEDLLYWYDKLDAEEALRSARQTETTILRLPKVYGEGGNAALDTVFGFAAHPAWRWTHGHVDNVAAAIALACQHPLAANAVFNLGEMDTPTVGGRLAAFAAAGVAMADLRPELEARDGRDFRQDMHTDTSAIRERLGFADVVDEREAMLELASRRPSVAP